MPAEPRTLDLTVGQAPETIRREGVDPAEMTRRLREEVFWGSSNEGIPPATFLLDQWIIDGGLTLVSAHGASGKTLLGLAWATAISRGVPWKAGDGFEYNVKRPGKVLYFTQEGISSIGPRIEAWDKIHGYTDEPENLGRVLGSFQLGADGRRPEPTEDWTFVLEHFIEEHDPVAVFLDPFSDYFSPGEENNNDDIRAWARFVRENILNKENAPALVVLTHVSKESRYGGESRGGSALFDAADRAYTMSTSYPLLNKGQGGFESRGHPTVTLLSTTKAKDGERPADWFGRFRTVEGLNSGINGSSVALEATTAEDWHVQRTADKTGQFEGSKGPTTHADVLQEALEKYGPRVELADLYDKLPTVPKTTIRSTLSKMVAAGTAENISRGVYELVIEEADDPDVL